MDIQVEQQKQYVIVTIKDEKLTARVAPELKSKLVDLHQEGHKNLILVLSEVKHIDSSGLSAILVAHRLCKQTEGSLIIASVQDSVQKLIDISQLNSVLTIVPTLQEAIDLVMMEEVERDLGEEDEEEEEEN